MAASTPRTKTFQSPNKTPTNSIYRKSYLSPSSSSATPSHLTPQTPQTLTPLRRSARHVSRKIDLGDNDQENLNPPIEEMNLIRKRERAPRKQPTDDLQTPKKSKSKSNVDGDAEVSFSPVSPIRSEKKRKTAERSSNKRVYYTKVEFDSVEFQIGDDVYVKRKEDEEDDDDAEFEDCRICFKSGSSNNVMLECDDCLGGFHLKCLKPPLKEVPEGDWICQFCQGHTLEAPKPPEGKKVARTAREKLLSSDLWAGVCEGDFKRLAELADGDCESDDHEWMKEEEEVGDSDDEVMEVEDEASVRDSKSKRGLASSKAANSLKGRFFGLDKVGAKRIPEHVRCHKQSELEKAKATLLLATRPKSLPCRNKEMEEITAFIKGSISDDQCLGRCMYIHGVPGTGKTVSVLSVMKNLKAEVEAGIVSPYCFVEINGLKLASPEKIYTVIYEALSGHRVGWKKALHSLNERFSEGKRIGKEDEKPCILLIDELDLLVTRNQSVLYNILDWPTKPNSKLIVLGIANTMDLPEKLLPRISSRMGIQRLCFGPYNHTQLQEIISTRLKGIDAFEKQAIEFASRKVAAISGDARRALEICRRAAEVADYRLKDNTSAKNQLVVMSDVEAAIQEMFQAPHIQVMKSVSKLSKIYLTAMVHELYKTGMAETTFDRVATTVSSLCGTNGEAFPGWDVLLKVGCELGECRIILCEPGERHRLQKLQLNFPSDDVAFALKDNKELPWLGNYL
ncbi:hypothetical protein F2Q68_00020575 [Brassica cretica]|uniref:Origin recognition complex subunit 1 n=1 Tax=Brassica cretica TaxID=69181 RepID=A0A8S9G2U4_BRACR|nr:hypothetical protein F2Q68_00020575 [Brassica cretica]